MPAIIGLIAVLALFIMHASLFACYINDDAQITFRYSYFLSQGEGPVYNPQERVEGYTNFSLMLMTALVIGLFGKGLALPFAKGIGLLSGMGAIVCAFILTRALLLSATEKREYGDYGGLIAAGLLAVFPNFALNSVNGLATTLFSFFLVAGVTAGIQANRKKRWYGAGIWFALAQLTRPETPAIFALYFMGQALFIISQARQFKTGLRNAAKLPATVFLIRDTLVILAVFSGHLLLRYFYYDGEWLPNTYYAKEGIFKGKIALKYIYDGAFIPIFGFIGAIAAVVGLLIGRIFHARMIPLILTGASGVLLPLITGIDWMPGTRLIVHYLPLFISLVVVCWFGLLWRLFRRQTLVVLCVISLIPGAWIFHNQSRALNAANLKRSALAKVRSYNGLADWLCKGTEPQGKSIALTDIGVIGFSCTDVRVLDISGLTDRTIAKSPGDFMAKQYDPAYVLNQKPDLIVLVFSNKGMPQPNILDTWTSFERAIFEHPEFKKNYLVQKKQQRPPTNTLDRWASFIGAIKIFDHLALDYDYHLTVFKRNPTPG